MPPGTSLATPEPRVRRVYTTGRRNDQRNEGYWSFDVHLAKEFSLGGGVELQLAMDVFNLFNDNTLQILGQENGFNSQIRRFGRRYQFGLRLSF